MQGFSKSLRERFSNKWAQHQKGSGVSQPKRALTVSKPLFNRRKRTRRV